jgi:hypothetical protein
MPRAAPRNDEKERFRVQALACSGQDGQPEGWTLNLFSEEAKDEAD